jgi:hypothetical protein
MKKRYGFVSNSSSSSFVCDVTGRIESGMDISLDDCEMYECEKEHIFGDEFLVKDVTIKDKREMMKRDENLDQEEIDEAMKLNDVEFLEKYEDYDIPDRYGIPSAFCPICRFKSSKDSDLVAYLLKKGNKTKESILKEIQAGFKDYDEFSKFISIKK